MRYYPATRAPTRLGELHDALNAVRPRRAVIFLPTSRLLWFALGFFTAATVAGFLVA